MTKKPEDFVKRKIYVVGHDHDYANWMQGTIVMDMPEADLVVFTGGEDVSPALYNAKPHPTTANNPSRDHFEIGQFRRALNMNKPMVGICRGSQFLCVMAGGMLVQHQSNPFAEHRMFTMDGKAIMVTSSHHQAQFPWNLNPNDFKVWGWTTGISPFHQGEGSQELVNDYVPGALELEVVHYPHIKALCIQSHPEWMYKKYAMLDLAKESIDWHREKLDDLMAKKL